MVANKFKNEIKVIFLYPDFLRFIDTLHFYLVLQ